MSSGQDATNRNELLIEQRTIDNLVADVKADILMAAYRPNATESRFLKLNSRIERVYEEEFGYPIMSRPVTPYHIMGSPGHGKTTCFKVAGQWAAERLGMNFVVNPTDDYELKDSDLLMVILDLSGETSNIKISGLPTISEYIHNLEGENNGKSSKYTTSAPPKSLQRLQDATVSMFLFDDVSNASPSIQNICLSVMLEKQYQALKIGNNTFVNSTGNLGALDGTNVSPTSTAMATRRQTYIGFDTPENWSSRTREQYPDNIGDAGLGGFFEQHSECFSENSKSKKGEPFACPRSWSLFAPYAREAMHRFNHQLTKSQSLDGIAFDMESFLSKAKGHVGINVTHKLKSYYLSLTNEVTPIANALLKGDALSEQQKTILDHHSKTGGSASEFFFGLLTRTMGEKTAVDITRSANFDKDNYIDASKQIITNFTNGMLECGVFPSKLNKINEGFSSFANKMAILNNTRNPDIAQFSTQYHQPKINEPLLLEVVKAFAQNEKAHAVIGPSKVVQFCCIDVLSNIASLKSTKAKLDDLDSLIAKSSSMAAFKDELAKTNVIEPSAKKEAEEVELSLPPPSMF